MQRINKNTIQIKHFIIEITKSHDIQLKIDRIKFQSLFFWSGFDNERLPQLGLIGWRWRKHEVCCNQRWNWQVKTHIQSSRSKLNHPMNMVLFPFSAPSPIQSFILIAQLKIMFASCKTYEGHIINRHNS